MADHQTLLQPEDTELKPCGRPPEEKYPKRFALIWLQDRFDF